MAVGCSDDGFVGTIHGAATITVMKQVGFLNCRYNYEISTGRQSYKTIVKSASYLYMVIHQNVKSIMPPMCARLIIRE